MPISAHKLLIKLATLIALLFICSCSSEQLSPEDQIRSALNGIETAAQERDTGAIMAYVTDDYRDQDSRDKASLRQIVRYYLLANQSINVISKINSIEVYGDTAKVDMSAMMSAQAIPADVQDSTQYSAKDGEDSLIFEKLKSLSNFKADIHHFDIDLVKRDNTWKVLSAQHRHR